MRYAVIMAGGAGERLWPLSRGKNPKQLLRLIMGKSLLELAVERLAGLFAPENILIITSANYADAVSAVITGIPRENIIGEPIGRDTANAICLGATLVAERDADATMAVFTADHIIRPKEVFAKSVKLACDTVEQRPEALATFGIVPTGPNTGLGYIHRGEKLHDSVYLVRGFREKPDHATARRYAEGGEYYWNSGMFVWKVQTILDALRLHLPDSANKLQVAPQAKDLASFLANVYPTLKKISIDFAVMEKAKNVVVVELGCEWLDVGSWPSLAEVGEIDEDGNAVVAPKTALLDSERNVLVSEDDHLIAMVGMDDCIVVHSPDATLICHASESQRLKELLAIIREKYGDEHL
ncbi:MAG: NTP transferase domain-containing protein [Planctomycetes bacterium]|nr:NTP transferase domain-containing protein [Planctomycetota bacterium]